MTWGKGLLLWLIGIPLPIILIIWLLGGLNWFRANWSPERRGIAVSRTAWKRRPFAGVRAYRRPLGSPA